jgi:hypothetical protein
MNSAIGKEEFAGMPKSDKRLTALWIEACTMHGNAVE